jgi:archaellum component FlaC
MQHLVCDDAKMEAMRESWTDDRLDHLNRRVDDGFKRVDERFEMVDKRFEHVDKRFDQMDQRFEEVDRRFAKVEADIGAMRMEMHDRFGQVEMRLDGLQRTTIQTNAVMIAALVGLIATQL